MLENAIIIAKNTTHLYSRFSEELLILDQERLKERTVPA